MRVASIALAGLAVIAVAYLFVSRFSRSEPPVKVVTQGDRLPLCPWREPERDIAHFFPGATNFSIESRGLSHQMANLHRRLGRPLDTDENPLRIHRIADEKGPAGAILVRRLKGEHGGIEIVTAVETNGAVRGVRIQSHREPAEIAQAITNNAWLRSFSGKSDSSSFRIGADLGAVPPEARITAEAIAAAVHAQLIVLRAGELSLDARAATAHTNH